MVHLTNLFLNLSVINSSDLCHVAFVSQQPEGLLRSKHCRQAFRTMFMWLPVRAASQTVSCRRLFSILNASIFQKGHTHFPYHSASISVAVGSVRKTHTLMQQLKQITPECAFRSAPQRIHIKTAWSDQQHPKYLPSEI